MPSLKRAAEPYREWHIGSLADSCAKLGIPFTDSNELFGKGIDESLFIDPLHLTDQGYAEMANLVESTLETADTRS